LESSSRAAEARAMRTRGPDAKLATISVARKLSFLLDRMQLFDKATKMPSRRFWSCGCRRHDAMEMAPQALGKIDAGDGNGAVRDRRTRMKGFGVARTGLCGSNRSGPSEDRVSSRWT
jgi:hypothetical protein